MKPVWRVVTLLVTLMFIYLLFPILIVPSTLPAIQEAGPGEVQIFELKGEEVLTLSGWLESLAARHRLGRQLIWQYLTQPPL